MRLNDDTSGTGKMHNAKILSKFTNEDLLYELITRHDIYYVSSNSFSRALTVEAVLGFGSNRDLKKLKERPVHYVRLTFSKQEFGHICNTALVGNGYDEIDK